MRYTVHIQSFMDFHNEKVKKGYNQYLKLWNFDFENNLSVIKSKVDTEKNIILDGYKKGVNHFEGALQLS